MKFHFVLATLMQFQLMYSCITSSHIFSDIVLPHTCVFPFLFYTIVNGAIIIKKKKQ